MKIQRVDLANFRGIEKLSLDFSGPDGKPLDLVVLAGPNGCGKTSVLEAIVLVLGEAVRLGRKADEGFNTRRGADKHAVQVTLVGGGLSLTFDNGKRHPNAIEGPLPIDLDQLPRIVYFSSWREPKLVGSLPIMAGKKGKRPHDTEDNRLRNVKQYLVNAAALYLFSQTIPTKDFPAALHGRFALEKIAAAWRYLYPERQDRFEVRPGATIEEGFDVCLVRGGESGLVLPVDSLSSGEIEAFTMLGWFATRDTDNTIVLFDEPELHLHPSWHRIVLPALRTVTRDAQLICATHSPAILESVKSYERFTLLPADDPRAKDYLEVAEGR